MLQDISGDTNGDKKKNLMIYIGIDPGVTGGITTLYDDGDADIRPMPPTEWDIAGVFRTVARVFRPVPEFKEVNGSFVVIPEKLWAKALIENVHAMPKQGVVSMFTFGRNYGFLRGCLVSLSIPFEEVLPQTWQKYFGLTRQRDEEHREYKKRILQKAQNMFPNSSVALQTADSLLIAEYLRRTSGTQGEPKADHKGNTSQKGTASLPKN